MDKSNDNEEKKNEFSDMLKDFRLKEGLSQLQLARKLHCSPGLIGMYEQGRRMPSFEMEQNIADFLNVSIDLLRGITVDVMDDETAEMVTLFHQSTPEMRRAALAVLKAGQPSPSPKE